MFDRYERFLFDAKALTISHALLALNADCIYETQGIIIKPCGATQSMRNMIDHDHRIILTYVTLYNTNKMVNNAKIVEEQCIVDHCIKINHSDATIRYNRLNSESYKNIFLVLERYDKNVVA